MKRQEKQMWFDLINGVQTRMKDGGQKRIQTYTVKMYTFWGKKGACELRTSGGKLDERRGRFF